MNDISYSPRDLGQPARGPVETVDRIPWDGPSMTVTLSCEEFTALCPVTGQPDFGTLTIQYAPRRFLVESKSLKLFLWKFRETGIFNEHLVSQIADALFARLEPEWIEVDGRFASRGGIRIAVRTRRPAE